MATHMSLYQQQTAPSTPQAIEYLVRYHQISRQNKWLYRKIMKNKCGPTNNLTGASRANNNNKKISG